MTQFLKDLTALCKKHSVALQGTLRIIDVTADRWDAATTSLEVAEEIKAYGGTDRSGPFLVGSIREKPLKPVAIRADRIIHINPDIAGYDCPVTGKWIDGRADHRENLKRTGCRLQEPGEKQEYLKNKERRLEEACDRTAWDAVRHIANNVEV